MKTPRLVILALWALLAPSFATAGPGDTAWEPVVQSGDEWKAVSFTDENGKPRHYWFKAAASGATGDVPLYVLTPKENPAVKGSFYYESVLSAYTLKVTVVAAKPRSPQSKSYVVTRTGTALALGGAVSGTLGASAWDSKNPAIWVDKPIRGNPKNRERANPYVAGSVKVVVAAPGEAREKLDPTPMTHFTQGVEGISWGDYYFERAPRPVPAGRGAGPDTDLAYRRAKESFEALHRRVLPFEVMLHPTGCFIRPEACGDPKVAAYEPFIKAGAEAKLGNLLPTEARAVEGHALYKAKAEAFKTAQAGAPEAEFTAQETALLQRILVSADKLPAFQQELAASRAKPETLKLFVKKWRAFLTTEIETYLRDVASAGSKEVDFASQRRAIEARIAAAVAQPLTVAPSHAGPVADRRPADPNSKINQATPASEWFAFTANYEGASPGVLGAAYESGKVYCRIAPAPTTVAAVKALGPKQFECVSLKQPDPKPVGGVVTAQVAHSGKASFIQPPPAKITDVKMSFFSPPLKRITLTNGRPMTNSISGATSFKPTTSAPGAASAPLALLDGIETRWLTKYQVSAYAAEGKAAKDDAARKAADDKYRALVKAQIRPEAAAAYAAAAALPPAEAPAKIKAAIGGVEMWGGAVSSASAVVAPFQDKPDPKLLEVQLSKAEYEVLKSSNNAAALSAYDNLRAGADGNVGTNAQPSFRLSSYDPIALHLAVEAARKALGITATPAAPVAKPDDSKLFPLLTEDQKKFLTPKDIADYEAILGAAPEPKNADKNVQALLKTLLAKIEARKAEPYPEGGLTEATFDKAPAWQKDKFCDPKKVGVEAASTTEAKLDFDPKAGTLTDLQRIEALKVAAQKKAAAEAGKPLPPWAVDKCKGSPFYKEPAPSGGNGNAGDSGVSANLKPGPDAEVKAKEKSKWITQDLLTSAAKGAMVGLLLGSLFGPIGLIAGPLLGAAVFYGLTKITG